MSKINFDEILSLLPHRYPFLLVDRVIDFEVDKSIHAIKNVTVNEPHFVGHFPVKPVMPGVLIIEALAQAAAILAYRSLDDATKSIFYLGSIGDTRFKQVVGPGDQLHLHANIIKRRGPVWKFIGEARVDGEVVCTTEMTSAEGKVE